MMKKGHSAQCSDLSFYWNRGKCVKCAFKPGYEVTPNCGWGDDGSKHEASFKPCNKNFYNNGSSSSCTPCSVCPSDSYIVKNCTSTDNIICQPFRTEPTASTTTLLNKGRTTRPPQEQNLAVHSSALWAIPLVLIVTAMLLTLSAFMINWKRKKGQQKRHHNRGLIYDSECLSTFSKLSDLEESLDANIYSAPLKKVLDNLDVLEELVILLDPEVQGIKNTKHLACLCSFPPSWVNYAYFMKESKSPLKALLEAVTSRNPDWTIGHLAELLKHIARSDAIAVLAKLKASSHICA